METLVLSTQDCPKDGWPKEGPPGMFAWKGDGYSNCSHLRQTSSDLSEQMHALGICYLPADMLPYGSRCITEKHFFFATSVIESGPARYNDIKYSTAPTTWHYRAASSQVNHQSRDIHWHTQGCRSGAAHCGWTFTKAKNYQVMGQVFCRYSSSCSVSGKSFQGVSLKRDELPVCSTAPMARASSLTHPLHRSKTSKHFTNRANIDSTERCSPTMEKFRSCKDSDVCARGVFYMEDEAHSMSFERMHTRLANKASSSVEKVDCNVPWTAAPKSFQTSCIRENCMKKDGKETLASVNDAPLDRIKGGQEGERSSMNAGEGKAIMCHSSASSKKDIYKDPCDGLMLSDPAVTLASLTPLAINGCSQKGSQSAHSLPTNERWAGPAFSNSPPPSSLPVPTFTRRQSRTLSLEIPRARAEFLTDSICVSAPGTPSRSFSLPNVGAFPLHLDTNHATRSLKRLLNLDLLT